MPNARFRRLPVDRQAQILDAAARAFGARGLQGASINRILAEVGLSKGAAYYYFEDKADLFDTVARHCWDAFIERVDFSLDGLTARNFWQRLEATQRLATEHMLADPVIATMAKSIWHGAETRRNGTAAEILAWTQNWIGAMVRKGQALGAIRKDLPEEMLVEMVVALDQVCDRWLAKHLQAGMRAQMIAMSSKVFAATRRLLEPEGRRRR
jgi:AcrR family transcriptional regulator